MEISNKYLLGLCCPSPYYVEATLSPKGVSLTLYADNRSR